MNVIVTGGAGFIGSHLVKALVDRGDQVIVIDNLITTKSLTYINDLIEGSVTKDILEGSIRNVYFIQADICDSDLDTRVRYAMTVLKMESIEEIYNLASPASVKLYTAHPELTFRTSTIGVMNMLRIAREFGPATNFLETSTSEVYGDPLEHPQGESYFGNVNTQCERSCYDEGKRSAEVLCYIAKRVHGQRAHVVRLFNVYGENNTDDRVMPTFIQQAMKGEPITVFGDGSQTRSFCYVKDVVTALMRAQVSNEFTPINLGNPEEITILDLAKLINAKFGNKSEIVFHPLPEMDPTRRCPIIEKAKAVLKWKPTTSLSEGVDKVIEWHLNRMKCTSKMG